MLRYIRNLLFKGVWISVIGSGLAMLLAYPRTPCEALERNMVGAGGGQMSCQAQRKTDLLPLGWRIFCLSLTPLIASCLFQLFELWVSL